MDSWTSQGLSGNKATAHALLGFVRLPRRAGARVAAVKAEGVIGCVSASETEEMSHGSASSEVVQRTKTGGKR